MYTYSCPHVLQVDSYVQVSLAAFRLVDLSSRLESTLAEVEGAVRRQCANLDAMQREHASTCCALRHWQEHARLVASVFFAFRIGSIPRNSPGFSATTCRFECGDVCEGVEWAREMNGALTSLIPTAI